MISEDGLHLVLGVWSRGALFGAELEQRRAAWLAEGGGRRGAEGLQVVDGVAVIPVCGPLFRRAGMMSDLSGATSYAAISKQLAQSVADPAARAILLHMDSPGGEAAGVAELAEQIRAACAHKPVLTYAEGMCASAAYWLASASNLVLASPSALLGSIGTRIVLLDDSGALEKMGSREIEIVSSQSPAKRGTPIDDAVLARLQMRADDLTDVFVAAVAGYRGTTTDKVLADYGQGDVMIASKAVAAGVADRLGTLDLALRAARERAMEKEQQQRAAGLQAGASADAGAPNPEALQALQAQLAALTGTTDPEQQQVKLAELGVKASMADALQRAVGDERTALLAKARSKGIPPVAMAGWEHLSLPALREVVEKSKGIRAHAPAANEPPLRDLEDGAGAAEPRTSEATLTDADRRQFQMLGVTDEAEMRRRKGGMKKGTTAKAFASGAGEE
jgi:ClpP class serine protease